MSAVAVVAALLSACDSTPAALGDAHGSVDAAADDAVDAVTGCGRPSPPKSLGNGTFGPPTSYAVGHDPRHVAVADLNQDGAPDVVVMNWDISAATLGVFLNRSDGTLVPEVTYPVGGYAQYVALGDLDGDGDIDAVVPSGNEAVVSVLRNNGDGTFATREDYVSGPVPVQNQSYADPVALGDLDRDGDLDVVISSWARYSIVVLLNDGSGRLGSPTVYAAPYQPFQSYAIAVGDLDGDCAPDVVVGDVNSGMLGISRNLGEADGSLAQMVASPSTSGESYDVALGDLDGDGVLEIVTDGFQTAIGHLDADDRLDKATTSYSYYMNNGPHVRLNQGSNVFSDVPYPAGGRSDFIAIADLDRDGINDLVVATEAPALAILRGLQ